MLNSVTNNFALLVQFYYKLMVAIFLAVNRCQHCKIDLLVLKIFTVLYIRSFIAIFCPVDFSYIFFYSPQPNVVDFVSYAFIYHRWHQFNACHR